MLGMLLTVVNLAQCQQTITLSSPPPGGVQQVSAQVIGKSGNTTYYYWVVANFTIGKATPTQTIVRQAPDILSALNRVRVSWNSVAGAISYDVLRSTSAYLTNPIPAVATALAATSYNDISNTPATPAYAVSTAPLAFGSISLDNVNYAVPTFLLSRPVLVWNGTTYVPVSGATTYQIDGVAIGSESTINFVTGNGANLTGANPPGKVNIQIDVVAPKVTFLLCAGPCVLNETTEWHWTATESVTFSTCFIDAATYPTGAALTVDVLKNGTTTIFSGAKLVLADGSSAYSTQSGMAVAATLAAGDYLIGKVTTIGSTIPGQFVNVACR